jgi:hypothetical protein
VPPHGGAVDDEATREVQLPGSFKVRPLDRAIPHDPRNRLDGGAQAGVGFYLQMCRIIWRWGILRCSDTGGDGRSLVLQFADGTENEVPDASGTVRETGLLGGGHLAARDVHDPQRLHDGTVPLWPKAQRPAAIRPGRTP